jgi:hypothetical protein
MPVNPSSHQFPIVPELLSQNQFPAVPYYVGGTALGTALVLSGKSNFEEAGI